MSATSEFVVIPERYHGPPGSAHGGYASGLLASLVGFDAEVTLKAPPPLARPLRVVRSGDGVALVDGETVVGEARPATVSVDLPEPVEVEEVEAVPPPDLSRHPFPTCYGCGPQRPEGEGLRLFARALPGTGLQGVVWTPEKTDPLHLWAAMDCPSGAPVNEHLAGDEAPMLGRLTVNVTGAVTPGEPHVILSWSEGRDGRKLPTGVAVHTAGGEYVAHGRAVWIAVPRPEGT